MQGTKEGWFARCQTSTRTSFNFVKMATSDSEFMLLQKLLMAMRSTFQADGYEMDGPCLGCHWIWDRHGYNLDTP
jgi:hypothetical protein